MAIFKSEIEKCASELEKLQLARARPSEQDIADRAELERLRASLPELAASELVDGPPPAAKSGEIFSTPVRQAQYNIFALTETIGTRPATMRGLMARIRAAV